MRIIVVLLLGISTTICHGQAPGPLTGATVKMSNVKANRAGGGPWNYAGVPIPPGKGDVFSASVSIAIGEVRGTTALVPGLVQTLVFPLASLSNAPPTRLDVNIANGELKIQCNTCGATAPPDISVDARIIYLTRP